MKRWIWFYLKLFNPEVASLSQPRHPNGVAIQDILPIQMGIPGRLPGILISNLSRERIVETAKRTGARVSGPIPLPTEKEIVTILRATHKYKDSREQFERRTHKRLIDIMNASAKTVDAMSKLELPAGVEIEMKL